MIRGRVDEDTVVIPPLLRIKRSQQLRKAEDVHLLPLRAVNREHLHDTMLGSPSGRVPPEHRPERLAKRLDPLLLLRHGDVPCKQHHPKPSVRLEPLRKLPWPRIALIQHLEAGKPHAEPHVPGKFLPPHHLAPAHALRPDVRPVALVDRAALLGDQHARAVIHRDATREQIPLLKRLLEHRHAHPRLVRGVLGWPAGEEAREAVVEVDEVLRYAAALGLVGAQDAGFRRGVCDEPDLPAQVERVLHADVHALAGFRGVCVHGVASEEDALVVGEFGADALACDGGGVFSAVFLERGGGSVEVEMEGGVGEGREGIFSGWALPI